MMQTNLGYLNQRQDVLSQNIANANVPGYLAKDLKGPDFKTMMNSMDSSSTSIKLSTTAAGHISLGTSSSSDFAVVAKPIKQSEITPTGNNVVLEDEVMKMSKTGLEYQQTADMYRKMLDLIKTAIGNV